MFTGIGLMGYGLVFGLVGASGMEKHSPEAKRREQELAEQQRIEHERIAREQRESAEQDRERERAALDKANRRDQAFALLKNAVTDGRADRCAAAIGVQKQIRELDANVHEVYAWDWIARLVCVVPPRSRHQALPCAASVNATVDLDFG